MDHSFWEIHLKRFTETNKWRDPWYRNLSSAAKQLWEYLRDNCDAIGLVEIDFSLTSADCGQNITQAHMAELGDRVQRVSEKKFFLTKFINFQYGELNPSCPPHRTIIKLVEAHNLVRVGLHYRYPNATLTESQVIANQHSLETTPYPNARVGTTLQDKTRQEKEPEKEPVVGDARGRYHKDSRVALHFLNEASGKHFRETDANLTVISARLREPEVTIDGVRVMIERQCKRWKDTPQSEYLRPETLFGKTKFDGYYAAKDLPINNGSNRPPEQGQLQEVIDVKTLNPQ